MLKYNNIKFLYIFSNISYYKISKKNEQNYKRHQQIFEETINLYSLKYI